MDRPLPQTRWQRSRWLKPGVVGLLVLGCAVAAYVRYGSSERGYRVSLANVTIAKVTRGVFHDFVPLRAKVVPLQTIYLDALEGGRVEHILAQAGDTVSKGQPFIELSNTELELDVLEREGRLVESITQLQTYQTQLEQNRVANVKDLAQIDYNITRLQRLLMRHKQLAARSYDSAETLDSLQDELSYDQKLRPVQDESNRKQEELRIRQLPEIESQLLKLREDLRITHSKLDNLVVRSPAAGRLTAMELQTGENRNRGDRIAEITPDIGYKLTATIDEFYLSRVREGESAEVELSNRIFLASVSRIYPQVRDGGFAVDLAFKDASPPGLLPGETVQGHLSLGADAVTLILPAGAFLERTGGDWVFVLDPDGRSAHRRQIKIGRRNAAQVEVIENLQPGEQVIVSDYSGLDRTDRIDFSR